MVQSFRSLAFALLVLTLSLNTISVVTAVELTLTVSSSTDDTYQHGSGTNYVKEDFGLLGQLVGCRFQDVTIPPGATITSATLEVFAFANLSGSFRANIGAQDASTPAAFSAADYDVSNRPDTSAQVPWISERRSYNDRESITSPDFASVIQEVVDRGGWSSGSSLAVIISPMEATRVRAIYMHDGNAAYAAKLHITYTTELVPVAHWRLDETSGSIAVDSSVNDNEGDVRNESKWDIGTIAGGLRLDGQNDYVSVKPSPELSLKESMSFAAWAYKQSDEGGFRCIVSSIAPGHSESNYWFGTVEDQVVFGYLEHGVLRYVHTSKAGLQPGQWYHLAATFDHETNEVRLYVNGAEIDHGTIERPPTTESEVVLIGASVHDEHWHGMLDEVHIYGSALPPSEIEKLATPALIGRLGHWKLDETSGTTAIDSSDAANDGTHTAAVKVNASGPYPGEGAAAAGYDGADGQTALPDVEAEFANGFSAACWVKVDHVPAVGSRYTFLCLSNGDAVDEISIGTQGGAGFQLFATNLHDGSETRTIEDKTDMFAGAWTHYVATVDGAGNASLYRNGSLVVSDVVGKLTSVARTKNFIASSPRNDRLPGALQDVRLYSRAITPAEVASLYGLVAHFELDDGDGSTAKDSSHASHHGTLVGSPKWHAEGVYGGSLEYNYADGSDYVELPNSKELDTLQQTSYSFSTWFKPSSIPPTAGAGRLAGYGLIKKRQNSLGLHFSPTTGFQFNHFVNDGSSSSSELVNSSNHPAGKWHHIVTTVNVKDGLVSLYVNGQLKETNSFTPGSLGLDYGTQQWRLGVSNPGKSSGERAAHGIQDETRFYNRVLSRREIAELYGLLLHLKLDETNGGTVVDSTPFEHHGSIVGTPQQGESAVHGTGYRFGYDPHRYGHDSIVVPETPELSRACTSAHDSFALSFWVKPGTHPGHWRSIIQKGTVNVPRGPGVFLHKSASVLHVAMATDRYRNSHFDGGVQLEEHAWSHVVLQGRDNLVELYVNGKLDRAADLGSIVGAAGPILIGRTYGHRSPGSMDEIRYYNRMLGPSEIAELHGLVGHWKFDEGHGTTAADSTHVGNDATLTGATWTSTCEGTNAIEFDGLGAMAQTASDFCPPATGAVAFWLRSAGKPTERSRLFGIHNDWEIQQEPDGTLSFDLGAPGPDEGAGGDQFKTTSRLGQAGRWYHVVAQFDAEDDSFEIYLNGEPVHHGVNGDDMVNQTSGILSFGTRTESTDFWKGAMRDFRVYNRKLSGQMIAELYGSLGHWKFNELAGALAVDSSGAGNHGTYMNSPTLGVDSQHPTKLGTAVEFNESNRMEVAGLIGLPKNVTIGAWVKQDADDSRSSEFFSLGNSLAVRSTGSRLQAFIWDGSSWNTQVIEYKNYKGSGWHHVAVVFNDTDNRFVLYVDGLPVATALTTKSISWTLGKNLTVAYHGDGVGSLGLKGCVDDVRLLGRALCAADVYNLYRDGRSGGVRIKSWVEVRSR